MNALLFVISSNENTNGLLRQYFPKGADLSVYSQAHLNKVARQLNERPRKTLGFERNLTPVLRRLVEPAPISDSTTLRTDFSAGVYLRKKKQLITM